MPSSTGGGNVDYGKVNVEVTSGGTTTFIPKTSGAGACSKGGWYYDSDPAVRAPTQIVVCPSTCQMVNQGTGGTVDIVLGCMTITAT